jgi:hypothetical protein
MKKLLCCFLLYIFFIRASAQVNLRSIAASDTGNISGELQVQGWKTIQPEKSITDEVSRTIKAKVISEARPYLFADAITIDNNLNRAFNQSYEQVANKLTGIAISNLKNRINADINSGKLQNKDALVFMQSVEKAGKNISAKDLKTDTLLSMYKSEGAMYKVQVISRCRPEFILELLIKSILSDYSMDTELSHALQTYFGNKNLVAVLSLESNE